LINGRAIHPSRNPDRARSKVVAGRVQQQHGGDQVHFELQALQMPETKATRRVARLGQRHTWRCNDNVVVLPLRA